ncbi:hypothetical protein [Variovorax boronicumulans]|uniref:hypothetical protein n=1 Tax=Variovorax boronicumulans TaxID=436515 RepID=UPI0012E54AEA|nr:hypothetical protein [Variovorax boronicumulans]GER18747.1 hypothetical protein VCH24_37750 [Variovorax boronicumulans]
MSLAGTRSNQGDAYQTLVAFEWAIAMLTTPALRSLEIDSTALGPQDPVQVDDVVVRRIDGSGIYCQCKKNEPDFKNWTVATLSDELKKAAHLLSADALSEVRFYSRSPFGELAKLRDYARTQPDEVAYTSGLSTELRKVNATLSALWPEKNSSLGFTFRFLQRASFHSTPEFEDMRAQQMTRLGQIVSSANLAYDAIWSALDRLGAKLPQSETSPLFSTHSLESEDLRRLVERSGAAVVPPKAQRELLDAFQSVSAVGRAWRREIGGVRLPRSATSQIVSALRERNRSILMTAAPGAGKSCVLLDVLDDLQTWKHVVPIYVQCRAFSDASTAAERETLGFPGDFVELVARMSEIKPVVVLFDSLDVLSLSREHKALDFFLAQIDRLLTLSGTAVVAAARAFDAQYDSRLARRTWDLAIKLDELDWEMEVAPLLVDWQLSATTLSTETRALLRNPRQLAMFHDLITRGTVSTATTHQDLTQAYLNTCVREDSNLGDEALRALESMALDMLERKSLETSPLRANLGKALETGLLSAGVLQKTGRGNLEFTHQTLLDVLAIGAWERSQGSLHSFIASRSPAPFLRPTIRAYVFYLGALERKALRTQLRAIALADFPHHFRRLVFETFAEAPPTEDDWPLIKWLRQHTSLFEALYNRADSSDWLRFWIRHLAPLSFAERDGARLSSLSYRIGAQLEENIDIVLPLWSQVLDAAWLDRQPVVINIGFRLAEYKGSYHAGIEPVLKKLLSFPKPDHDSLGGAIVNALKAGVATDEILWNYITADVDEDAVLTYQVEQKLRCEPHIFATDDRLIKRMKSSDRVLDLAINSIEHWVQIRERRYRPDAKWSEGLLRSSSYEVAHRKQDFDHVSKEDVLVQAVEAGVLDRARTNSVWWQKNKLRLAESRDGVMRYWVVLALTRCPTLDLDLVANLGSQQQMLTYSLSHEVGEMIGAAMPLLSDAQQDRILQAITAISTPDEYGDHYAYHRCKLIKAIPACFREPKLGADLKAVEDRLGPVFVAPEIGSSGGWVRPPFGFEIFILSDTNGVLRLLQHYGLGESEHWDRSELVGGAREVGIQLSEAVSRAPRRFLSILATRWSSVPERFRDDFLDGCVAYARHRNQPPSEDSKQKWSPIEVLDDAEFANIVLEEIERHPSFWSGRRSTAYALEAIANKIDAPQVDRFSFQLFAFRSAEQPQHVRDVLMTGINSARGKAAEAAVVTAIQFLEAEDEIPPLLLSALRIFSADPHPAVRVLILRHMPYFISQADALGWEIFDLCMKDDEAVLWQFAEPCLYYAYRTNFSKVSENLDRIWSLEGQTSDVQVPSDSGETRRESKPITVWGRISTLSSLADQTSLDRLLDKLNSIDNEAAWIGAVDVWVANAQAPEHRDACFAGLHAALGSLHGAAQAASKMNRLFEVEKGCIHVPTQLVDAMFSMLPTGKKQGFRYFEHRIGAWLEETAATDPESALTTFERLAKHLESEGKAIYDDGPLTRALTSLFREAEEREMGDQGRMLRRVVCLQDSLLISGVHGLEDWLRRAERP